MRIFRSLWLVNLLALAGCGGPEYKGPPSDHFDGQQFYNQEPFTKKSFWTLIKWQLTRERPEWVWQALPPRQEELPERVTGNDLRVTYINHATLLIQYHGLNILTDPVWSERVSPFSFIGPKRYHDPGVALEKLPPLDLIFVSHSHYDHMDLATLRRLAEINPLTPVVTLLGNAELIRKEAGFGTVTEMDWWQSQPLNQQVTLHIVPSQHWSARTRFDTNRTLWGGFVLESASGPVYFPGDTAWGGHFQRIHDRFGPMRFSALSIGAYEPRWFMVSSHMNPQEAVAAHKILHSSTSMGIHFGTFPLSDEAQFAPPQDLAKEREAQGLPEEAFRAPLPGESWTVPVITAGH